MEAFSQLEAFWAVLMGLCAAVIAVGGAATVLSKLYQMQRKPSEDNAASLEEIEVYLASDKRRIEGLEKRQDEFDDMNKLQLKALVTLMSHELDGNHTRQLGEVRDEIQNYLIEK